MILQKKDGSEVLAYTNEERMEALNVSLVSLASSMGYTPIRSGAHYILKEMDSLVIYNDRTWNRWSGKGRITGGTTIDFLMAFDDEVHTVPEAIRKLVGGSFEQRKSFAADKGDGGPEEEQEREFELPPKNTNYKRLFAYLINTRGLSQEIVYYFVHQKLIYEDALHHNIVFCGRDPEGKIRYAGLRGTADLYGKKFKMDVAGNDKNYGVNIVNKDSQELKVFESVIDCMSYMDMTGDYTSNKLVLSMVADNPLEQFLKDYNHIKQIVFCLDNDEAGQRAIYGEQNAMSDSAHRIGLKEKYESLGFIVAVEHAKYGKDFNEELLFHKEQNKQKENINTEQASERKAPDVKTQRTFAFSDGEVCVVADEWIMDGDHYVLWKGIVSADYMAEINNGKAHHDLIEYDHTPTRDEVESDYIDRESARALDEYEAEYGADGRRVFPHLNDEKPISAEEFKNIKYIKAEYSNFGHTAEYTLEACVRGESVTLHYEVTRHDGDEESFSIHTDPEDIYDTMSEKELKTLEEVLSDEVRIGKYELALAKTDSIEKLKDIEYSFMDDENFPKRLSDRFWQAYHERENEITANMKDEEEDPDLVTHRRR